MKRSAVDPYRSVVRLIVRDRKHHKTALKNNALQVAIHRKAEFKNIPGRFWDSFLIYKSAS